MPSNSEAVRPRSKPSASSDGRIFPGRTQGRSNGLVQVPSGQSKHVPAKKARLSGHASSKASNRASSSQRASFNKARPCFSLCPASAQSARNRIERERRARPTTSVPAAPAAQVGEPLRVAITADILFDRKRSESVSPHCKRFSGRVVRFHRASVTAVPSKDKFGKKESFRQIASREGSRSGRNKTDKPPATPEESLRTQPPIQ